MTALFVAGAIAPAWAKLPPPPPLDEKAQMAAAEKKKKDAETAEKAKAALGTAQDRAVKSFQTNMKKSGKPIPKPTPIVAAAAPAKAGEKAAEKAGAKK